MRKSDKLQRLNAADFDAHELMEHQQLKLLYAAIPNSLLANLFGSIIAIVLFTGIVNPFRLYTWVGILVPLTILRFYHYRQFMRAVPGPEANQQWYVKFRIGSILMAFAIGSAGILLFIYDNSNYQMLLALLIVCMASFATSTLAPHRPIVVLVLLIQFFPIVATMFLLATDVTHYISWVLILLVVMMIISALGINKTVTQSIRLSIEAAFREERLRDFKQRLTAFVQETPLAVIEWNLDKNVVEWNPAAEVIFGYKKQEVSILTPVNLMYNEGGRGLAEILDEVIAKSGEFHSIQENRCRDGALVLCEWINTPLIDADDKVVGILSLVQDVTQRIANERLKNEFVSIVSHELRTPVTSIKAGLSLLASGVLDDDKEKSREMLDVALKNTNRLHMLINDILDVDKLESGKMEYRFGACDLGKLVDDVVRANQSYALQYSVNIRQAAMPAACTVYADSDRLFQVLTNLLSNAIKFSEKNGEVLISVQCYSRSCRVAVTNRGEVIQDADREQMFGKFFQRDSSTTRAKGGTGLGLYICQKILREHGTTMDFESSAEKGTTFFFDLSLT